jgi:hypothetical protein
MEREQNRPQLFAELEGQGPPSQIGLPACCKSAPMAGSDGCRKETFSQALG